jgi:hypothetical protein
VTADKIKKYSQKQVDVLNLREGTLETIDFRTLYSKIDHPDLFDAVSVSKDGDLFPPLFKTQDLRREELCLTFDHLLARTKFVPLVKKVLSRVEAAYGRPVDMEFAWDGNKLYLLQCRSLSTRREQERVPIPESIPEEQILFTTQAGLSNSVVRDLEYIVYVDPRAYDRLATHDAKMKIAHAVNLLNKAFTGKRYVLMGPGRWGSNDINLGVRVTYADINHTKLLVEIAFAREGYTPEVSYGTHFFQDLVEADIIIVPLFPDDPGSILNEALLLNSRNLLREIAPEMEDCEDVVRVIHVPSQREGRFLHVYLDLTHQKGIGFFGPGQAGGASGGSLEGKENGSDFQRDTTFR